MKHLLVRHKVAVFDVWKRVFDANLPAARDAGLELKRMFRDSEDPDDVFLLFAVHDEEGATAFITAPAAHDAASTSGVLEEPDCHFLDEVEIGPS